jgi:N-acetylmuramoyl-L-alanine amidase
MGQNKNFILMIDPGHGGSDAGAIHGRYREKELNLEVALALGTIIEREIPGVEVLYTRTTDVNVDLAVRGDKANRAGADLFLSIHTNAAENTSAGGTETFVMGMDKSEGNLEVAKRENAVIKYEENYEETYAGFDENSAESSIIFGMLQFAHFESSLSFARMVQRNISAAVPLRDRGAKQAPFMVLWRATMPRVLTEIGFISNETDRKYIFSEEGKRAIVRGLFDAFREYKSLVDADADNPPLMASTSTTPSGPSNNARATITAPVTPGAIGTPATPVNLGSDRATITAPTPAEIEYANSATPNLDALIASRRVPKESAATASEPTPARAHQEPIREPEPVREPTREPVSNRERATVSAPVTEPIRPAEAEVERIPSPSAQDRVVADYTASNRGTFYVQLGALRTRVSVHNPSWRPFSGEVVERRIDGWYKYALGPFNSRSEAAETLEYARRNNFPAAFIVTE